MMRINPAPTPPLRLNALVTQQNDTSQSISGRYRWLSSAGIESSVQMSIESASIEIAGYFKQDRTNYDLDYQGRYTFAAHDLLWGLSHRTTADKVTTSALVISIRNPDFTQRTTGVFVHDDWTLIPETLQLGAGARWDYTNLGGNTFAPSATLMWTPSRSDSLWLKYAKAPRHYGSLRSQWNVSPHQQFDAWIRGSAGFERTNALFYDLAHVPGYVTLDLRYAHKLNKDLEIAVSGRNLIGGSRNEYISDYIPSIPLEVRPSLLVSAHWAF